MRQFEFWLGQEQDKSYLLEIDVLVSFLYTSLLIPHPLVVRPALSTTE